MDSIIGILFKDWIRILSENKFKINLFKSFDPILISILSLRNTFFYRIKEKNFSNDINNLQLTKDPIFILGHWRSGTTFLVNLLALDNQFNYPKIYQVNNPNSFLYISNKYSNLLKINYKIKRPMDNVRIGKLSPAEEEFAIAVMSLVSSTWGWVFPSNYEYYENYLDFKDVNSNKIQKWMDAHYFFIKKLSLNDDRQLLLKSPGNTAKIKFLLKLYPNAKFIHIHRNPFNVFKSMMKLFNTTIEKARLQKISNVEDKIISTYKRLYAAYFEGIPLIPKENFIDISFEELEKNKIEVLEQIYSKLQLNNYSQLKSKILELENINEEYKKNKHSDIDLSIKSRLIKEWNQSFEKWNYKE